MTRQLLRLICLLGIACAMPATGAELSVSDATHRVEELRLSPDAKYIHFEPVKGAVALIETDCLLNHEPSTCEVFQLNSLNSLYYSGYVFNRNSKKLTLYSPGMKGKSITDKSIIIEEVDLKTKERSAYDVDISESGIGRIYEYFKIISRKNEVNIQSIIKNNFEYLRKAKIVQNSNLSIRPRNIYGVINENHLYYIGVDKENNVFSCVASNICNELEISGKVINLYTENLNYSISSSRLYFESLGTIFRIDKRGKFEFESSQWDSARLINSDDYSYMGYHTRGEIYLEGVSKTLDKRVRSVLDRDSINNIHNVSISNSGKTALISWSDRFDDRGVCFNVIIVSGDRDKTFNCKEGTKYQVKTSVYGSLVIKKFFNREGAPRIIYLHGGPYSHVDVSNSFFLRRLIQEGYNVDVIEYAGSDETYYTLERLARDGAKALIEDAAQLSNYIRESRGDAQLTHLYVESFGARIFKYMSPDVTESLGRVVLDMPAGYTDTNFNNHSANVKMLYEDIMGKFLQDIEIENKFYEELSTCQLNRKVMLYVGRNDKNVNPLYDYRNCLKGEYLDIYIDDLNHGDSSARDGYDKIYINHYEDIISYYNYLRQN